MVNFSKTLPITFSNYVIHVVQTVNQIRDKGVMALSELLISNTTITALRMESEDISNRTSFWNQKGFFG